MTEVNDYVGLLKANENSKNSFELDILYTDKKKIGRLRLIDMARVSDPKLVGNLTRWRNVSMRFFQSQFHATEERTQKWLDKVLMPSIDRLMFEILDDTDRVVGHAGVSNLRGYTCELDNFIRGEPGGDPNLFVSAETTMLRWLFCDLKIKTVTLFVFSNNWIPIINHLSIGFIITHKHTLSRIELNGESHHLLDSNDGHPVNYSYLKMCLSSEDFLDRINNNS